VNPQRHVHAHRDTAQSAPLRCLAYAACSELTASPHELDPRPSLLGRIGLGAALRHASDLDALLLEVGESPLEMLRSRYSNLFEVGDSGPPVPIRAQLAQGARAGALEEVVRYYEHFGYVLGEKIAWQPDHLSVELEFMHFLCFHESQASGSAEALPFELAQADFANRHLVPWLPAMAARVHEVAARSLYARVIGAVAGFVAADAAWQLGTIGTTDAPAATVADAGPSPAAGC
jgi:DMSO reductase family type II enzyme chaperone